jgi:DNA-binding NarL/FixJ family response regulator
MWLVMKSGADGYILKDEDIFSIPVAIRKIMAGQPCISPQLPGIGKQVPRTGAGDPSSLFTEKEIDILRRIAEGRSNKDIALETGMALRTVETHIAGSIVHWASHHAQRLCSGQKKIV